MTPAQVNRLRLDPSPLVPFKNMPVCPHYFTCQAEAIPPGDLAKIVRKAITDRLDDDAYNDVLEREKELPDEPTERL